LVRDAAAGVVVPQPDAVLVWDAIRRLQAAPGLREVMGNRGRSHVAKHFGREMVLNRYLGHLEALTEPRRPFGAVPDPSLSV